MIKHIVMFKLAEKNDANLKTLVDGLRSLKNDVPQIIDLEVGVDFNGSERAMDVNLYTTFNSKEDLSTYQAHPKHQVVVNDIVKKLCNETKVVDYEV